MKLFQKYKLCIIPGVNWIHWAEARMSNKKNYYLHISFFMHFELEEGGSIFFSVT